MQLRADQELRREMLFFALNMQPDVEAAIGMAALMEQFVLDGHRLANGEDQQAEAAREAGAPNGSSATQAEAGRVVSQQGLSEGNPRQAQDEKVKVQKRRWSEADDRLFTELWQSDRSLEEIASELDRTVPSLYSRARSFGLSKRDSRPVQAAGKQSPASTKANKSRTSGEPTQRRSNKETAQAGSAKEAAELEKALPQVIQCERYGAGGIAEAKPSSKSWRSFGRNGSAANAGKRSCKPSLNEPLTYFVDPIIQFLRSRDYSVVRVGDGQFKLDGRKVVNAEELRQKANQVRKFLGQPPFASHLSESVD